MSGYGATIGYVVGAVAGFFIGGPLGSAALGMAIGGVAGSLAGSLIDRPKQNVPKIYDTKIRGADYGTPRAILYGMCRIGGVGAGQGSIVNGPNQYTVEEGDSGGKGNSGGGASPARFKVSFLNEICEGPITGVRRRWVNNKLWTTNEEPSSDRWPYTLYLGGVSDTPDPTMETIYGAGNVSPMRGIAKEMVRELSLDDWGQARPNVEYEAYKGGGEIPWRVSEFDPWPEGHGGTSIMLAATYDTDTGLITTSAWDRVDGISVFHVNQFRIDGTHVAYNMSYVRDAHDLGYNSSLTYMVRNEHRCIINGPGPGHFEWWYLREGTLDFVADSYLTGALLDQDPMGGCFQNNWTGCVEPPSVFGPLAYSNRPSGNFNVWSNGRLYWCDNNGVTTVVARDAFMFVLDAHYVASNVSLGTSDTGHIYVSASNVPGERKLWKLDEELQLVHFWDVADTAGCKIDTMRSTNFHVYNNHIAITADTSVLLSVVRINGDNTLEDVGPQLVSLETRLCDLGNGLGIDRTGVYSLVPPPSSAILGDIVTDILHRAGAEYDQIDMTDLTQEVRGVVFASQMTAHNQIELLRAAYFFDVTEYDDRIIGRNRGHGATETIPDGDLCAHVPGTEPPEPLKVTDIDDLELPDEINVNYYNVDNDYQRGTVAWRRQVTRSRSKVTIDLPVVFTPGEAMRVAQNQMHFAWLENQLFEFWVSDKWLKLRPTDVVVVRGVNVRLTEVDEEPPGIIKCVGVRAFAGAFSVQDPIDGEIPGSGGSGQPPQEPPQARAPTTLILIDGPLVVDSDSTASVRAAVYPATTGAWPGFSLQKSVDGGTTFTQVATGTNASTAGVVATATPDFLGGNVVDAGTIIRVVLRPGQTLSSTTLEGMQNGVNLVALGKPSTGWEFLQFMTATLVGTDTYDLSNLLRGRMGTEWFMGEHGVSEYLILLSTTYLVPGALGEIGVARQFKAVTSGTAVADATAVNFTNTGVAGKALSGVELGHGIDGAGDITLYVTPRRRGSGGWPNGTDLPATDPAQWQFEISITGDFTDAMAIGSTEPEAIFTVAAQTTYLGTPGDPFFWRVAQWASIGGLGYFAESEFP